jgi:hypothetical protein
LIGDDALYVNFVDVLVVPVLPVVPVVPVLPVVPVAPVLPVVPVVPVLPVVPVVPVLPVVVPVVPVLPVVVPVVPPFIGPTEVESTKPGRTDASFLQEVMREVENSASKHDAKAMRLFVSPGLIIVVKLIMSLQRNFHSLSLLKIEFPIINGAIIFKISESQRIILSTFFSTFFNNY